jgi:hypothetical protein
MTLGLLCPLVALGLGGELTSVDRLPDDLFVETKIQIQKILASDPSVPLSSVAVQLMASNDARFRRDSLKIAAQIQMTSRLKEQLSVMVKQDSDPLCQAQARLLLADQFIVNDEWDDSGGGFDQAGIPDVFHNQGGSLKSPKKRSESSKTKRNRVGAGSGVSTADFTTDVLVAPDGEPTEITNSPADATVLRTRFSTTELPPAPWNTGLPFPEINELEDSEPVEGSVPGLLDQPLTDPDEIFDIPIEASAWPVHSLMAPLGFSGKSGILPTEVQENEHFVPVTDRWRSGFPDWDRYGDGPPIGVDTPYKKGHWWDPYNQNVLKGDYPFIGQHTFMRVTGQLNSLQEYRQLPTPATDFESTARPGSNQLFGNPNQYFTTNFFKLSLELFHGDTSFKPLDWSIRITPIFNANYLDTKELGIVNTDVRRGTTRFDDFMALEEYFIEAKLKDLSADYDFVSARVGSQPFTSDFRGFIFSDTNRAVRLFGTRLANRDQFNIIALRQAEKDTNSLLNTFEDRNQNIFIANYYRQDFVFPGYTAQFSVHYNNDGPAVHYDTNGFLVRPDPVGVAAPHRVQAAYVGFAGDGHIGRINISNAFYWVGGRDSLNPIAGDSQRINAQMAAGEISYDRDWIRFRVSGFYSSGDRNPYDHTAQGFDSILDSPNFAGSQFSYWQRQQINLQGVGLVNRFSLIPDLRSSKFEGQSNFVNPGLRLLNLGMDFELTPKTRLITNANYLQFDSVRVLQAFTFQNQIRRDIGVDLSAGLEYRPLLNDNVILTGGYACLLPGGGFRDLYGVTTPFATSNTTSPSIGVLNSAFAQCILQY